MVLILMRSPPHTHISDHPCWATEQPCKQCRWLQWKDDHMQAQQAALRHAHDQPFVDWDSCKIPPTCINELYCQLYDQSKHKRHKHSCDCCLHEYSRENFEALTMILQDPYPDSTESNSHRTQHQEAYSCCYILCGAKGTHISYEDRIHMLNFWEVFSCRSLRSSWLMSLKRSRRPVWENTAWICPTHHICSLISLVTQLYLWVSTQIDCSAWRSEKASWESICTLSASKPLSHCSHLWFKHQLTWEELEKNSQPVLEAVAPSIRMVIDKNFRIDPYPDMVLVDLVPPNGWAKMPMWQKLPQKGHLRRFKMKTIMSRPVFPQMIAGWGSLGSSINKGWENAHSQCLALMSHWKDVDGSLNSIKMPSCCGWACCSGCSKACCFKQLWHSATRTSDHREWSDSYCHLSVSWPLGELPPIRLQNLGCCRPRG